ncbi:uncharacterized protein EV422DRAFT_401825 [Fimicolochytrium jonesii]|uniref:uncharacterized protein n=1 Tax=Fimicolochytrium jonesii TaxID=1396493 RepID=UPI0022FE47A0|nr:uncharacterized protein EV422DRAFT_401825 [Fimicolochytrium jonesii]KAI8822505.1 hypothetical protein EV422DRAFT_401825 [Fimicolochytrium jonesii]
MSNVSKSATDVNCATPAPEFLPVDGVRFEGPFDALLNKHLVDGLLRTSAECRPTKAPDGSFLDGSSPASPPTPTPAPTPSPTPSLDPQFPAPKSQPQAPVAPSLSPLPLQDPNPPSDSPSPGLTALEPKELAETLAVSSKASRGISNRRPKSMAVGFTIGPPSHDSATDSESSPESIKARRLSYNGHQNDHLAALQNYARTAPNTGSSSVDLKSLADVHQVTGNTSTLRFEAPYIGPLLSAPQDTTRTSVESSLPASPLRQLSASSINRRAEHRLMVIDELMQTERMYVHDLRTLVESFFDRLNAVSWVPSDKKFSLMRNASELYRFQQEFLSALEETVVRAEDDADVAAASMAHVFLEMQHKFTVYSQYCTHHDGAIKTLREYERRPEMVTFLKDFRGLAQTKLDVKDYLIKPVQRLCRYPLLINEVIKNTAIDSPTHQVLTAAHGMMQHLALEIDSAKWRMENMERTDRFFSRLEAPPNDLPQRLEAGDFILSGALFVVNYDQFAMKLRYRGVFLFPEYLLVVKPRRMTAYNVKTCLSLSLCEFRRLGAGEGPFANGWRLTNTDNGQNYDFCALTERERTVWTDALLRLAIPAKSRQPGSLPSATTAPSPSPAPVPGPSSRPSMSTEIRETLRRSSSTGWMSVQDGGSPAPQRERPSGGAQTPTQRRKFWRQSSADLRYESFPEPNSTAANPSAAINMSSYPTASLVRRASVDMRLLDVLTPIFDPLTQNTGTLSSPRSVPNLKSAMQRSATLNDLTEHAEYHRPDSVVGARLNTSRPPLPPDKRYSLRLPPRTYSELQISPRSARDDDYPPTHSLRPRDIRDLFIEGRPPLPNRDSSLKYNPDLLKQTESNRTSAGYRVRESETLNPLPRSVLLSGASTRSSPIDSIAPPLLHRYPSQSSFAPQLPDRSAQLIPPLPPLPVHMGSEPPIGRASTSTYSPPSSSGSSTSAFFTRLYKASSTQSMPDAPDKERRNNLLRRTWTQIFHRKRRGLRETFGLGSSNKSDAGDR